MDRLTPISPGVVHSSPYRTRLKATRWKEASESDVALVKDALERVPGVLGVRPLMLGFVIEHEARPDVVENIGIALAEVSPVLLEDLTSEPHRAKKKKAWFNGFKDRLPDFQVPEFDFKAVSLNDAGTLAKKAVPAAMAGAGVWMLIEGGSLLAGVAPLTLLYWAYDLDWKMKQEKAIGEVAANQHE